MFAQVRRSRNGRTGTRPGSNCHAEISDRPRMYPPGTFGNFISDPTTIFLSGGFASFSAAMVSRSTDSVSASIDAESSVAIRRNAITSTRINSDSGSGSAPPFAKPAIYGYRSSSLTGIWTRPSGRSWISSPASIRLSISAIGIARMFAAGEFGDLRLEGEAPTRRRNDGRIRDIPERGRIVGFT